MTSALDSLRLLGTPLESRLSEGPAAMSEARCGPRRVEWCGRKDSNLHALAGTSS
jgi:hypothetical protein